MTQDEIIEIAKQAGGIPFRDSAIMGWGCEFDIEPLEAFAKLVAEKERNRLADELQKMPLNDTANSIAIWIRGQE